MKSTQPAFVLGLGAASVLLSLAFSWHSGGFSALVAIVVGGSAWFMGAKAVSATRNAESSSSDKIIAAVGYSAAVAGTIIGSTITLMFLIDAVF